MIKNLKLSIFFKKFRNLSEKLAIYSSLRRYKLVFSRPFFPLFRLSANIFKKFFKTVPKIFLPAINSGSQVKCLCCGWDGIKFLPYANRINAQCPNCGAVERDRMIYLFLQSKVNFFYSNLKILDIGPAKFYQDHLSSFQNLDYLSIDLYNPDVMIQMDATNMTFPDRIFDVVLCSNVLEHIKDDIAAISEIFRVLKPGGFSLILVPIGGEKTFEDPTIPPEKYAECYGCSYHVRLYGLDLKDKLESIGFKVKIEYPGRKFKPNIRNKYGFQKDEIFFLCVK